MIGSLRIARIFGIEVRAHVTFVLLLLLAALNFGQGAGTRGALFGVLLVLAQFACITLHELGHSLVARRFGAQVREIVLLPIGGMARMLREPKTPWAELATAVAGPLVNVVIAFALAAVWMARGGVPDQALLAEQLKHLNASSFLLWLMASNMVLAVFNMIPALPMDGGRVLRASLSFFLGRTRATVIAAGIGQLIALGFVGFGLFEQHPWLLLIGVFVFLAAGQERRATRASDALQELTAGEVCHPAAEALAPSDDLGDAVDHALRTAQTVFPVLYGTDLVGVVLRDEVLLAAGKLGLRANLSHVLRRNLPAVRAEASLVEVRERINETGLPVVVLSEQKLMGILSAEDLARITEVSIRLASSGIRRPPQPRAPEEVVPRPRLDTTPEA
ncbi:MAG: site-2 protease family protein [Polyangiaceae bacterium]